MNNSTSELIKLARRWCPIYYLHSEEEYFPCDLNDLVRASYLKNEKTGQVYAGGRTLTPREFSRLLEDDPSIRTGHTLCLFMGKSNPLVKKYPRYEILDGKRQICNVPVYVHVRRHPKFTKSDCASPSGEGNHYLITYALAYAWNGATSIIGHFGEHEADIEHVTCHVRTGAYGEMTSRLENVYFSQHFGGEWVDAQKVRGVQLEGSGRPVVCVAKFSHASYAEEGRYKRFWGLAIDECDKGTRMDPRDHIVLLSDDCLTNPDTAWMMRFRGDMGDGHVNSLLQQTFFDHTDKTHNSGRGFFFSTH